PWGWGGWGMNWGGGWGGGGNTTIIYNHNTYISNRSWHGGYYNNYHSWTNRNVPNGGRNGDHGLIGGNGGVQRDQHQTGFNNDHRDANRNRWGGDGNNNRA